MNFEFNDEQKALQQLARRVAKDKVAPRAAEPTNKKLFT